MGFCKPMSEEVPLINTKTISKEELDAQRENAAKVQAVLRRAYSLQGVVNRMEYQGLALNLGDATVEFGGERLELTKNEFRILQILMENAEKIVPRDEIIARLWESDEFIDDNTLTVNVARLRRKLESLGARDLIRTRKGIGYFLKGQEE